MESGTVFFAPNNYHLLLEAGPQIALSVDDLVHYSRPSVDVLFESAADVYRNRLLGILLTGANEDGAQGLAMIQESGGITIAQEPATAQSPQMVNAALKLKQPTYILALGEIAAVLATLGEARTRC